MSKIPEWFKSEGFSDKELDSLLCPNGSFTCGLRTSLGIGGLCNLCKPKKDSLSDKEKIGFSGAIVDVTEGSEGRGFFMNQDVKDSITKLTTFIEKKPFDDIKPCDFPGELLDKIEEIFGAKLT